MLNFEALAAAYLKAPKKPQKPQREPKRVLPKEQTTEKEKPVKNANTKPQEVKKIETLENDLFTPEEIEMLEKGEQIRKTCNRFNSAYFATPFTARTKLIFSLSSYQSAIPAGCDAKYTGFLLDGKAYTDPEKIQARFDKEMEKEIEKRIPTQEKAIEKAGGAAEVKGYLEIDWSREAFQKYVMDKPNQLNLYGYRSKLNTAALIRYMEEPEKTVDEYAETHIDFHAKDIAERFIQYNGIKAELEKINADESHDARKIKAIKHSVTEDMKSVKIQLVNGHTVKAETRAISCMGHNGTISEWYIQACDRQYLGKNEYGRPKDIELKDILEICHGQRTLWKA